MLQKQKLRWLLVGGLFFISLGGWILHVRIHPPADFAPNYVPFIAGLISFTAVPAMFLFRKTVAYAYVINGMLVIIGTITMTHYSLANPPEAITFGALIFGTLFPDVVILFTNFMLGKAKAVENRQQERPHQTDQSALLPGILPQPWRPLGQLDKPAGQIIDGLAVPAQWCLFKEGAGLPA